jgi:hypothetical protein
MEEAKEGQRGPGFLVQAEEATRVEPRPCDSEEPPKPGRGFFGEEIPGEEIRDDTDEVAEEGTLDWLMVQPDDINNEEATRFAILVSR